MIRADASTAIGSGHVMRCLSLGEALRQRGGEIEFVTQLTRGNLAKTISEHGFRLHELAERNQAERRDALDTLHAVGGADLYVVDHYSLGATWETTIRMSGSDVIAIDDLADRRHTASLVVDSTYPGDQERYAGLADGRLLLGTRFAMLSHIYTEFRQSPIATHPEVVPRVLVYFGASDLPGVTLTALDALTDSVFQELQVDVVVGPNNPHSEAINQTARSRNFWRIHEFQASLAHLLRQATYAVTGGGVALLERACLGVPGLTITLANNQEPSTIALASAGVTHYVGSSGKVTSATIRDALVTLTSSTAKCQEMSHAGMTAVDGLGASRVAEILLPTPLDRLSLRPANIQDAHIYFGWVNESDVRAQSLTSDAIDWDSHMAWFTDMMDSPFSHLYVLEANGLPVAQARFEQRNETLLLAYSVDDLFRGRGLGVELVRQAIASLPHNTPRKIEATVKASNHASLTTLARAGFVTDNPKGILGDRIRLSLER